MPVQAVSSYRREARTSRCFSLLCILLLFLYCCNGNHGGTGAGTYIQQPDQGLYLAPRPSLLRSLLSGTATNHPCLVHVTPHAHTQAPNQQNRASTTAAEVYMISYIILVYIYKCPHLYRHTGRVGRCRGHRARAGCSSE